MKKKILSSVLAIFVSTSIFANETINNSFDSLIDTFSSYTPENTSMLFVQPEAYIGKLFPSFPPHLTAGISASGTFLDTSFLSDLTKTITDQISSSLKQSLGSDTTVSDSFKSFGKIPIPTAAINARIGGIFLPFDLGVFATSTFNAFNDKKINNDYTLGLTYNSFGADLRFRVLEEDVLFPSVSVGAGYIYTERNLSVNGKFSSEITYENTPAIATIGTDINAKIKTHSIFLSTQVSKKIAFLVPFAGFRLFLNSTDYSYDWKYNTECKEVTDKGISMPSENGSNSEVKNFDFSKISPQLFAGLGFNFAVFQIGLNGAYNFKTDYWTVALQLNFKL